MREEYSEIHSTFLFLYHRAIGYLIGSLLDENPVNRSLFSLPIIMHVAVNSFSVTELHETFVKRKAVKAAITVAPLIGVLLHNFRAVSD